MFRNHLIIIISAFMLSACAGGITGTMSSSGFGHWQIYKVSHKHKQANESDQTMETKLDHLFSDLGFERKSRWHSPLLKYSRVATFQRKYKDRYITIYTEVSERDIIFMSTSYSVVTENIFNNFESQLYAEFAESKIERCHGRKDIYGHSCFQTAKTGSDLNKLFSLIFGEGKAP